MRRLLAAGGWCGQRLLGLLRRLAWPVRSPLRMIVISWIIGTTLVGHASLALASGDGLINGPDLAGGSAPTAFEAVPTSQYELPLYLDSDNSGFPYVSEGKWGILQAIESGLVYLALSFVRGAISALQWLLSLTVYRDQADQIDEAVNGLAGEVFWPLIGASLAAGAISAYARARREGGGTVTNDVIWMIAAAVFSLNFVVQPSNTMMLLDDFRTSLSDAAIQGFTSYAPVGDSAMGYPQVAYPEDGGEDTASRKLADSMWNVYAVTPWCYVAFNDLDMCRDLGYSYVSSPQVLPWPIIDSKYALDSDAPITEFGEEGDGRNNWVRGQDFGRFGAVLFLLIVTIPIAIALLILVAFGLMAVVGFLILLLVGALFCLLWMIPGRSRAMGVRWFETLLGTLIQSVIITTVIGAVMIVASIFNYAIPEYGFFMVGLLNAVALVVAMRFRYQLESIVGYGSPATGTSLVSAYMASRAMSFASRWASGGTRFTRNRGAALGDAVGRASTSRRQTLAGGGAAVAGAAGGAGRGLAPLRTHEFTSGLQRQPGAAAVATASSPSDPPGSLSLGPAGSGRSRRARDRPSAAAPQARERGVGAAPASGAAVPARGNRGRSLAPPGAGPGGTAMPPSRRPPSGQAPGPPQLRRAPAPTQELTAQHRQALNPVPPERRPSRSKPRGRRLAPYSQRRGDA